MNTPLLLSIKKFSKLTGITESTLRFYDKIGLLSPTIRGGNNYRYYSPLQTITANCIKVLSGVGVHLSFIKQVSKSRTPHDILNLFINREYELNSQLLKIQKAYSVIHAYRENIQIGTLAKENSISIQDMNDFYFRVGKPNDFSKSNSFHEPFMDFCNSSSQYNIDLGFPVGGYHEDISAFLNAPAQPSKFFSQDPHGNSLRKAGQYLVAYQRGYYGEFGDTPQKILAYAQEKGFAFCGPVYSLYVLDEICMTESSQYLCQIVVGVTKA